MKEKTYAVCIPVANEEEGFADFVARLKEVLDENPGGSVYLVVDNASKDATPQLCEALEKEDPRFHYVWAPENRNVVDAYLRGFKEAVAAEPDYIVEMDGGGSHDPAAIPAFLRALREGNECAFGSRYINGGSLHDSPFKRRFLSKFGSFLGRTLLGCGVKDATSGYEAFTLAVMKDILAYPLRSRAHFYQTELRYLLNKRNWVEVPIHYVSPSPRVSPNALKNSLGCLFHYTLRRFIGRRDSV